MYRWKAHEAGFHFHANKSSCGSNYNVFWRVKISIFYAILNLSTANASWKEWTTVGAASRCWLVNAIQVWANSIKIQDRHKKIRKLCFRKLTILKYAYFNSLPSLFVGCIFCISVIWHFNSLSSHFNSISSS